MENQSNGMAVASLTLGIIGIVFSIFALIGIAVGLLALTFGLIGRQQPYRRTMATWGAVLGLAAIGFSVFGAYANRDYFDEDAIRSMNSISAVTSLSERS